MDHKLTQLLLTNPIIDWHQMIDGPLGDILEIISAATQDSFTVYNYWCLCRTNDNRTECMQHLADEAINVLNGKCGETYQNQLIQWINSHTS